MNPATVSSAPTSLTLQINGKGTGTLDLAVTQPVTRYGKTAGR